MAFATKLTRCHNNSFKGFNELGLLSDRGRALDNRHPVVVH